MKQKINYIVWSFILAPLALILSGVFSKNALIARLTVSVDSSAARHVLMERDTAAAFSYTPPASFLGAWTIGFKNLRTNVLVSGSFPTSLLSGSSSIADYYSSPIAKYHFPGVVLLVILFLCMILLIVSSCFMCCNSCCCKTRLGKKYAKMKTPSALKKACATACLLIPSTLAGICIYIHLAGSSNLSNGLNNSEVAIVNMLVDVDTFFINLAPSFGSTLDTLAANINSSIDGLISSVNFDDFTSNVQPSFESIISTMLTIETSKESIIGGYPGIVSNTDSLQANATALRVLVGTISTQVAQLSAANQFTLNTYAADNWRLTNPVSFSLDANSVESSADSSPDTASIFGSLQNSANLTTSGLSIQNKINSGVTSAQDSVTNTSTTMKRTISSTLTDAKSLIVQSVSNFSSTIGVDSYVTQIQNSWTTVRIYDNQRSYGQMGLVLLYCLPVLFISIGGAVRSPGLMKGVNLACVPYYALLFFLAIIFLLFSLILGDACNLIFDADPSPLGPLLGSFANISQLENTTTSVGNLLHSCATGSSLLDVASQVGLNTTAFNFTKLANDKINSFNLSVISSVNLSSVVSFSSNPNSDANSTTVDLSTLTVAPFAQVISQTNTLTTNLTSLGSQLNSLKQAGTGIFTITNNPPAGAERTEASAEFNTSVNAILTNIARANQIISVMQSLSNTLTTSIRSVNSTANYMLGNISAITPLYNTAMDKFSYFAGNASSNLTNAIPTLQSNLIEIAANVSLSINSKLGCVAIGTDFDIFRQGFCGDTMAGLDSFWSTLTIMALCGFASLPLTVFAANTLFLDLTQYQRQHDPEFEEQNGDIEKGKKSQNKDGKVGSAFVPMNVLKTQEVFSPLNQTPVQPPAPEDDEYEDDDEEDEEDESGDEEDREQDNQEVINDEVIVEIDKNSGESDDQQEFESRQANISIQSDLMQFSPVVQQKPVIDEAIYEIQENNVPEFVVADNATAPPPELPSYTIVETGQESYTVNNNMGSLEFNTIKSQKAILGDQGETAGVEAFPTSNIEAFPSSGVPAPNPYLERLQASSSSNTPKSIRKNTLNIDRIQSNSFSRSHQPQASFGTTSHRRGTVNSNDVINTDDNSNTGATVPAESAPQQETQFDSLQAQVEQVKISLPEDADALAPPEDIRGTVESIPEFENTIGELTFGSSAPPKPISAKPKPSVKRSPSTTPSTPPLSNQTSDSGVEVQAPKQSLPTTLLVDISNPTTAKRSSYSPDMFSPPKVEPVEEGTKPSVPYDDLLTLAKRFKLPELVKVAETLTVDQVSTMDVVEAEGFGISRDAYFKLKRYFISRRKYV